MAVATLLLRTKLEFTALPLHGIMLLTGLPGVGDPYALAGAALGKSQKAVDRLAERNPQPELSRTRMG